MGVERGEGFGRSATGYGRYRAYGVVVTLSCLEGDLVLPRHLVPAGLVPESEKETRSVSRNFTLPYVSCAPPSLSHLLISFPPGRGGAGGRARGAVRTCGVCLRVTATRDHWLVLLTTKALSKNQLFLTADRLDTGADWRVLALSQANHHTKRILAPLSQPRTRQYLDRRSTAPQNPPVWDFYIYQKEGYTRPSTLGCQCGGHLEHLEHLECSQ